MAYKASIVAEHAYKPRPSIGGPHDVVEILRAAGDFEPFEQERFFAILLDHRNHAVGCHLIAQGTLGATLVHPRDVFRAAVRNNAARIIVTHCHPSGDPEPSREDREFTRTLVAAGKLLGIEIIDHVVVGRGYTFASFKARGELES